MSKIYINGFDTHGNKSFSLTHFFKTFDIDSQRDITFKGIKRYLIVDNRSADIANGLVLTDTDQTAFLTVTEHEGNIVANVEDTPSKISRYEFLFFRLNKHTGRGLFTQYRGSGGVGLLRLALAPIYKSEAEVAKRQLERDDKKKEAKELNNAKLLISFLPPNHDFLDELKKVKQVQRFDFTVPFAKYFSDGSLKDHLDSTNYSLKIKTESQKLDVIKNAIRSIFHNNTLESGKVHGVDYHDNPLEVPINPDSIAFDKFEFESVANNSNFPMTERFNVPIIKQLETIMNRHGLLFGPPAKP